MAGPNFFMDKGTAQTSAGGVVGHVPWMQAVIDSTDLPLAVAQARGTSVTGIKLYGDLTPELATRITAEAHRQDLFVWAHATLYPAKSSEVIAAGVDTVSHACLLVRESDAHAPSANTGQAYRAGVPIDAGTDKLADWTDSWPDLLHELTALSREAGMPSSSVLESATLIGARATGQQQDMGTIARGKLANMVVLARDPLIDLNNLRSIVMTVKRGRMFNRNAFCAFDERRHHRSLTYRQLASFAGKKTYAQPF